MSAFFKLVSAIHSGLFRATSGRLGGAIQGQQVVLLTTTGRKTGKPRTVPVMAFEDGGDRIVTASKGGSPEHPAWFNNLVATPEVTVEVTGRKYAARAEVAGGEERARLWKHLISIAPGFAGYEKRVDGRREIPMVRLKEIRPAAKG